MSELPLSLSTSENSGPWWTETLSEPAQLTPFRIEDDTMAPTLRRDSWALVALGYHGPHGWAREGLFLIRPLWTKLPPGLMDSSPIVRRLRPSLIEDGRFFVRCDSRPVSEGDELWLGRDFEILGKVIFACNRID